MSSGRYFITYTGSGVADLGEAGLFQSQTSAFVSVEIAERARKHGDFIVKEIEAAETAPKPAKSEAPAEKAPAAVAAETKEAHKPAKSEEGGDKKKEEKAEKKANGKKDTK